MKQSRWSPADLDRQLLVVHRLALRTGPDLRALEAARDRLVADLHDALGDRPHWLLRGGRRGSVARTAATPGG